MARDMESRGERETVRESITRKEHGIVKTPAAKGPGPGIRGNMKAAVDCVNKQTERYGNAPDVGGHSGHRHSGHMHEGGRHEPEKHREEY